MTTPDSRITLTLDLFDNLTPGLAKARGEVRAFYNDVNRIEPIRPQKIRSDVLASYKSWTTQLGAVHRHLMMVNAELMKMHGLSGAPVQAGLNRAQQPRSRGTFAEKMGFSPTPTGDHISATPMDVRGFNRSVAEFQGMMKQMPRMMATGSQDDIDKAIRQHMGEAYYPSKTDSEQRRGGFGQKGPRHTPPVQTADAIGQEAPAQRLGRRRGRVTTNLRRGDADQWVPIPLIKRTEDARGQEHFYDLGQSKSRFTRKPSIWDSSKVRRQQTDDRINMLEDAESLELLKQANKNKQPDRVTFEEMSKLYARKATTYDFHRRQFDLGQINQEQFEGLVRDLNLRGTQRVARTVGIKRGQMSLESVDDLLAQSVEAQHMDLQGRSFRRGQFGQVAKDSESMLKQFRQAAKTEFDLIESLRDLPTDLHPEVETRRGLLGMDRRREELLYAFQQEAMERGEPRTRAEIDEYIDLQRDEAIGERIKERERREEREAQQAQKAASQVAREEEKQTKARHKIIEDAQRVDGTKLQRLKRQEAFETLLLEEYDDTLTRTGPAGIADVQAQRDAMEKQRGRTRLDIIGEEDFQRRKGKYDDDLAHKRVESWDYRAAQRLTQTVTGLGVLTAGLSVVGMGVSMGIMEGVMAIVEYIDKVDKATKATDLWQASMVNFGFSAKDARKSQELFNNELDKSQQIELSNLSWRDRRLLGDAGLGQQKQQALLAKQLKDQDVFGRSDEEYTRLALAATVPGASGLQAAEMEKTYEMIGAQPPPVPETMTAEDKQQHFRTAVQQQTQEVLAQRGIQQRGPGIIPPVSRAFRAYTHKPWEVSDEQADRTISAVIGNLRRNQWKDVEILRRDMQDDPENPQQKREEWAAQLLSVERGFERNRELLENVDPNNLNDLNVNRRAQLLAQIDAFIANSQTTRGNLLSGRTSLNSVTLPSEQPIDARRMGGHINSTRFSLVGEAGPEVVVLPGGSDVIPNNRLGDGNSSALEQQWSKIERVNTRGQNYMSNSMLDFTQDIEDMWQSMWKNLSRFGSEGWHDLFTQAAQALNASGQNQSFGFDGIIDGIKEAWESLTDALDNLEELEIDTPLGTINASAVLKFSFGAFKFLSPVAWAAEIITDIYTGKNELINGTEGIGTVYKEKTIANIDVGAILRFGLGIVKFLTPSLWVAEIVGRVITGKTSLETGISGIDSFSIQKSLANIDIGATLRWGLGIVKFLSPALWATEIVGRIIRSKTDLSSGIDGVESSAVQKTLANIDVGATLQWGLGIVKFLSPALWATEIVGRIIRSKDDLLGSLGGIEGGEFSQTIFNINANAVLQFGFGVLRFLSPALWASYIIGQIITGKTSISTQLEGLGGEAVEKVVAKITASAVLKFGIGIVRFLSPTLWAAYIIGKIAGGSVSLSEQLETLGATDIVKTLFNIDANAILRFGIGIVKFTSPTIWATYIIGKILTGEGTLKEKLEELTPSNIVKELFNIDLMAVVRFGIGILRFTSPALWADHIIGIASGGLNSLKEKMDEVPEKNLNKDLGSLDLRLRMLYGGYNSYKEWAESLGRILRGDWNNLIALADSWNFGTHTVQVGHINFTVGGTYHQTGQPITPTPPPQDPHGPGSGANPPPGGIQTHPINQLPAPPPPVVPGPKPTPAPPGTPLTPPGTIHGGHTKPLEFVTIPGYNITVKRNELEAILRSTGGEIFRPDPSRKLPGTAVDGIYHGYRAGGYLFQIPNTQALVNELASYKADVEARKAPIAARRAEIKALTDPLWESKRVLQENWTNSRADHRELKSINRALRPFQDEDKRLLYQLNNLANMLREPEQHLIPNLFGDELQRQLGYISSLDGGYILIRRPDGRVDRWKPSPRAMGGPTNARGSYLVGERGPEILNLRGGGSIRANHSLVGDMVRRSSAPVQQVAPTVVHIDGEVVLKLGDRELKRVVLEIVSNELRNKG